MKLTNLSLSLLAIAATAFSGLAQTPTTTQGGAISLTSSPQKFTTLGFYSGYPAGTKVQRISLRVIPGFCGKLFIGTSAMTATSASTYAGVIAVLYPNCNGGLSDEYVLDDRSGQNGIDAAQFYVMGQVPGDVVAWDTYQINSGAAATLLRPTRVGPYVVSGQIPQSPLAAGSAVVQTRVVPGMIGKIRLFGPFGGGVQQPDPTYLGAKKVLWPNTGQNITDSYEIYDPAGTNNVGINSTPLLVWPEVSGEFPLIAIWTRS